jgi:hypothetical protein
MTLQPSLLDFLICEKNLFYRCKKRLTFYIPIVGLTGPAPGRAVAAAGQSAAQRGAAAHS